MNEYAKAVKAELSMALAKHGMTLNDFEDALQTINTGEGVLKAAMIQTNLLHDYVTRPGINLMSEIPELAMKGSLAGGVAAGLTLDDMDESVSGMNDALANEYKKVKIIKQLTENLKREHGLQ